LDKHWAQVTLTHCTARYTTSPHVLLQMRLTGIRSLVAVLSSLSFQTSARAGRVAFRSSLVVGMVLAVPGMATAQATSTVTGVVVDKTGRPLASVLVELNDAKLGTSTDRDGAYRITRVPQGPQKLRFRYIGYAAQTVDVTVGTGTTVVPTVSLSTAVLKLDAIAVTGTIAGQAAALNQQRAAGNVSSVIDNELVGRLPDPNLAEALARVPGVAVVRDQGEGRFVQIRGTSGELNSMTMNGMRISTPEQNTRQLPMDLVPSDQAAAIQVSKTLTPDMDADAIGGNVNVVTRTARANRPLLNLTAAGGQNSLGGGALVNLGLNAGKRFGASQKLGVMAGGTYYRNDRASQNFEGDWCSQTRNCGVGASVTSLDAPNLWELRDYPQVNRVRQGVNGTIDYLLGAQSKLFVRGTYNQFSDDEVRFRTRFGFRGGSGARFTQVTADSGTVTGSRIDRDIRLREVTQHILTAQVGGEHNFGTSLFDWAIGTSAAREDRPDVNTLSFRQTGATLAYNFADAERPRVSVVTGSFDDPTRFPFNSLASEVRKTTDTDISAKLNYSFAAQLGRVSSNFKFGASARLKERENKQTTTAHTNALGTNTNSATGATLFSTLVTDTQGRTIFGGDYNMGRHLNPDRVRAFVSANRGAFTRDNVASTITSQGGTYKVGEDVYAGYAMATLDVGALRLIPGVRIEATQTDNEAGRVQQSGTTVTVTPVSGTTSYTNFFPSINATYRLGNLTNIRAAVTTSMVRPQFREMAPYVNITVGQPVASIGNPSLKATTALAYDFMVEQYFENVGFISAGAFYKDLKDFIFVTRRARLSTEELGPDATQVDQATNGPTAKLYGYEVAWQQPLTFLPGFLAGLGVNANYTYTKSESTLPTRPGSKQQLPGQTGNAGNIGVFYDRGPLSLRVGGNYSGQFLSTINPTTPEGDTRTRSRFQVDASGSLNVMRGTKVFIEAINLSNTPLRATVGNRENRGGGGDDPSFEFYRPWAMLGIKIER